MAYQRDGRSGSCEIGHLWLMATPAQAGRYRDADRPHMCFASYDLTRTSGQAYVVQESTKCTDAMCLNRGMALPERGAPFTTAGFARIERLGKIAEIVVRGTSPYAQARLWVRACQSGAPHKRRSARWLRPGGGT